MAWMKRSWVCNDGAKKRGGGTGLFWKTCAQLPEANLVLQWIYQKNFGPSLSLSLSLPFHLDRLWNRMTPDENVSQTFKSGIWVMNRQPENGCSASTPHLKETEKDARQRNGRKGNRLSFLCNGYLLTWLFAVHAYLGLEVLGMLGDCRNSFFGSFSLPNESNKWLNDWWSSFLQLALISIPWFSWWQWKNGTFDRRIAMHTYTNTCSHQS